MCVYIYGGNLDLITVFQNFCGSTPTEFSIAEKEEEEKAAVTVTDSVEAAAVLLCCRLLRARAHLACLLEAGRIDTYT